MAFYTKQHQMYCGIDLHAWTMSLCILYQTGDLHGHRRCVGVSLVLAG